MQTFGTKPRKEVPQTEKLPGRKQDMRMNNAGGAVFRLDRWKRLERFLILGTEGGTFYVSERKLDKQNTTNLLKCIAADYRKTVDIIVDVSDKGRSMKNDMAIFALAVVASSDNKEASKYALESLQKVCRIGTHLFHFAEYIDGMRGWGRSLRRAIGRWYTEKNADTLALQLLKYKQRDGWSHRDLLRLSHAKPESDLQAELFKCAVGKETVWPKELKLCKGQNLITEAGVGTREVVAIVSEYGLPREMIPTEYLNEVKVWAALLQGMPVTALIRNLGKMASLSMLEALSPYTKIVIDTLTNQEAITRSRVHPITIFNALKVYANGHNVMGASRGREMTWNPTQRIIDALEKSFYLSFGNVQPTGKSMFLALDVSGSMNTKLSNAAMSCREASALMAMVTARVESNYGIFGFTRAGSDYASGGYRSGISELRIGPNQSFGEITKYISGLGFEGTDCSIPMLYALQRGFYVDTFVVYTDNETWAGEIHPSKSLQMYRERVNPNAKLVVVGMTATNFSIADPEDAGMLDVVGFDTNTPLAIAEFSKG